VPASKLHIGILGFGSFGKLLTRELLPFGNLYVYDPMFEEQEMNEFGVQASSFEQVCQQPYLIFCIPVQILESTLVQAAPLLKPGTLVIDVSSVKMLPMEWMSNHLPEHVEFIGTHPLFGPQSGKNSISGLNLVICQGRSEQTTQLILFLKYKLGLNVLVRSAENHDKQMAYVQGLTHLVGRVVNEMDIPDVEQKTQAYQFMLDIKRNLGQDSWDLFLAIEKLNPYAKTVRDDFARELLKLNSALE